MTSAPSRAATRDVVALIAATPGAQALGKRLAEGGALSLNDVAAPAWPLVIALLARWFPQRPIVVVPHDLKAQESLHQDLQTWFGMANGEWRTANGACSSSGPVTSSPLLFYPAWEVLPHQGQLPHADVISERLETLTALAAYREAEAAEPPEAGATAPRRAEFDEALLEGQEPARPGPRGTRPSEEEGARPSAVSGETVPDQPSRAAPVVVAAAGALLERTFAPDWLRAHCRTPRRGDRLDPLDLIEWLEDQAYEPEAQVTRKGELALRGGIVDVFPLTSPWPVRLEFFGDVLESLRFFDPHTQISREEAQSILLSPAGELGLLRRHLAPPPRGGHPVEPRVEPSSAPEAGAPLTPASFLDHLPANTLLVWCDPRALAERARRHAEQVPASDPLFVSWEQLQADIAARGLTRLALGEGGPGLAEPTHRDDEPTLARTAGPPTSEPANCQVGGAGGSRDNGPAETLGPSVAASTDFGATAAEGACREARSPDAPPALSFTTLEAYRPLGERAPDQPVAEAQRRHFFDQLHRWRRQGYTVELCCNNLGEQQRFAELWRDCGFDELPVRLGTLSRGFLCEAARVVVVTDAEIFGRYKVQRPRRLKSPHAAAVRSALDIDFTDLAEGDYVVHLQYGIGRYLGLQRLPAGRGRKGATTEAEPGAEFGGEECLVIEYAPSDPKQEAPKLYVPVTESHLVSKYVGAGRMRPPLNTLSGTRWTKAKAQASAAVRDFAAELLRLQAARAAQPGFAFPPDVPWQREFESAFIYEETPDQLRAIEQTKLDLEQPKPMDRLICGDVGFGKTEVAIRAAFKAVLAGRQVAILVPTTVLAQQHYNTFRERMADYPVRVELLSRFRTRGQQDRVIRDLAAGGVDIVIGTHRLVQPDVVFKDLGLVVIDEEQRFGVAHKERLKQLRQLVDVLTLSATPIPRTLYLALTGARDMSTIETPPQDRLPIETIIAPYDERLIRDAIQRELNRGGQVFYLHNRILDIEAVARRLKLLVPHARLAVGHGQMQADDLEEVMTHFVSGELDVLLSTTIIESGIDIPNANTIIIDRADRFGLSDLYQLRGRVGRYKHQAFAYLLIPRHAGLLADARKRISAIRQFSTPGSGFKIAMRDLEIRGAGNLLGPEQSGHITAVGFELYCRLLKHSVAALKGEPIKPPVHVSVRFDFLDLSPVGEEAPARQAAASSAVPDPTPHASRPTPHASRHAAACLPLRYVPEPHHRIEMYRKLGQVTDKAGLEALRGELRDRFGPLPGAVELLLQVSALKLLAAARGLQSMETRDDRLMLTRAGEFVQVGGRFPRLTKRTATARLNEIRRVLLTLPPVKG